MTGRSDLSTSCERKCAEKRETDNSVENGLSSGTLHSSFLLSEHSERLTDHERCIQVLLIGAFVVSLINIFRYSLAEVFSVVIFTSL